MSRYPFFSLALSLFVGSLQGKTPAEVKVEQAQAILSTEAKRYDAWAALADAYARRARESGRASYYKLAEEALSHIPASSEQYDSDKVRVQILLARGNYVPALELARKLNKRMPDELTNYGFIVEAGIALGLYDEAEKAAQWMLDLRPTSPEALLHSASLRETFGDYEGSLDFLKQVYGRLPPEDVEERAWVASAIARNLTGKGDYNSAEIALKNAFKDFPDYHLALERLGKLKLAQKKPDVAIEPFGKRLAAVGSAQAAYDLAIALSRSRRKDEAKAAFARFEELSRSGEADRERILYLADAAGLSAKAVELARKMATTRNDVFTLDALAWALFRDGKQAEAEAVMAKVRKVGTKDPDILSHDRRISPEP